MKRYLDEKYQPQGYNLGWNCGEVGGHIYSIHIFTCYQDIKMNYLQEKELDICLRVLKIKEEVLNIYSYPYNRSTIIGRDLIYHSITKTPTNPDTTIKKKGPKPWWLTRSVEWYKIQNKVRNRPLIRI